MVDLSALGAQAVAQVDKARKAAAESLASAMHQKPKLDLTLELDAPKIAIPVPATSEGKGMCTLLPCQNDIFAAKLTKLRSLASFFSKSLFWT